MFLLGQSEENAGNNGNPQGNTPEGGLDSAVSHLQLRAIKSIYTKAGYHKPFEKLCKEEIYPSLSLRDFFLLNQPLSSPVSLSSPPPAPPLTTSGNF